MLFSVRGGQSFSLLLFLLFSVLTLAVGLGIRTRLGLGFSFQHGAGQSMPICHPLKSREVLSIKLTAIAGIAESSTDLAHMNNLSIRSTNSQCYRATLLLV